MFTVTAKGIYGLTAMVELAKSYQVGTKQIKDIAETHQIPQHYLEQILVALKKAGLVESFRGAQGGYALAKSPTQIMLLDILGQLEGKLEVINEQKRDSMLAFFWEGLEHSIRKYLHKSLEDLVIAQEENQNQVFYSI